MSFEVFMQSFKHGESSGTSALAVQAVFSHLTEIDRRHWAIRYDDENRCEIFLSRDEGGDIRGLTVSRPCSDKRLWTSMFRVLQLGSWVLYYPAKQPPIVVADKSHAAHLPASMLEALGPIHEVHSGEEILRLIQAK